MNFTRIFNGMVGRDFIAAFNDNFNITNDTFLSILATLIYKVKSTDIKEFKVIDNVVSYTLDPEPQEGEEDTRIWTPVDITQWGNILGNIEDQTDLWNILQDKAAVETVETINNLLSTLRSEFDTLKNNVEDDESLLNTTANSVANLEEALRIKVNSTNIKAIRLNNSVFQWSPDGNTWYEQPVVNSIAWGRLTGNIANQEDLMARFTTINNNISAIDSDITSMQNDITNLTNSLATLDTTVQTHLTQDATDKATINNNISAISATASSAATDASYSKNAIDAHLEDYDNPHHVTKATVGLENVDNTSDMNKPLSTAQKNYVDTQIESIIDASFDGVPILKKKGLINHMFVGTASMYSSINQTDGTFAFVLDDNFFKVQLIAYSNTGLEFRMLKNGTEMIPDSTGTGSKIYNDLLPGNDVYTLGITVDNTETTYSVEIDFVNTVFELNVDEFIINAVPVQNSNQNNSKPQEPEVQEPIEESNSDAPVNNEESGNNENNEEPNNNENNTNNEEPGSEEPNNEGGNE